MMFVTKEDKDGSDNAFISSVFNKSCIATVFVPNPGYQEGAILALIESYKNG